MFGNRQPAPVSQPAYAQYYGEVWVPGNPSHMPGILWTTSDVPWRDPRPDMPPAPQPHQPPMGAVIAPALPLAANTAGGSPSARQGAVTPPNLQPYQFMRAPTALEAALGPQYNPAQLLGLE